MTQFLDPDDDFTEGATGTGVNLVHYKRFVAWTSDSTTGYAIPCPQTPVASSLIDLHNGYVSGTRAAFRNAGASIETFGACLFRPIYPPSTGGTSKGTVRLTFSLLDVLGTHDADSFRYVGVCARASGQTTNETFGSERMIGGSSYWFLLANKSTVHAGVPFWHVLRVIGGVVSVIQSTPATIADISAPINISMMVEAVGVNTPHIVCKLDTAEIFNFNDTDGSALTTAGRFGFGMCRDRQVAGVDTVAVAHAFEIDDSTDTIVHRDEWQRVNTAFASVTLADGNGVSGTDLMSLRGGDEHGQFGGFDVVVADGSVTQPSGTARGVTQRAATDQYKGHRSVDAWFTAAGSASPSGRVLLYLRGAGLQSTAPNNPGYALSISVGIGPVFTASILYGSSLALGEEIVREVITGQPGIGLGQWITMEFSIRNVGAGAPASGVPRMVAKINGVAPNWTIGPAGGLPAQITINGDGSVDDHRSFAPLSGSEEAMFIAAGLPGLGIRCDNWQQLSLVFADGQIHTSQHIIEGFARIGMQPAEPVFVPDVRVSTSFLEGFYGIPPEARFSQSIIEGFFGTVVPEAKLSQSILEGFYAQDLSAGAPPDNCIKAAATGPMAERAFSAGAGVVRAASNSALIERSAASGARVAAVGATGARVERIGVSC